MYRDEREIEKERDKMNKLNKRQHGNHMYIKVKRKPAAEAQCAWEKRSGSYSRMLPIPLLDIYKKHLSFPSSCVSSFSFVVVHVRQAYTLHAFVASQDFSPSVSFYNKGSGIVLFVGFNATTLSRTRYFSPLLPPTIVSSISVLSFTWHTSSTQY